MTTINLLSWREKHVQIQNNKFYFVSSSAGLICVILTLIVSFSINVISTGVKENISYLKSEISLVEGKIKKIKGLQEQKDILIERRKVIEALQASRPFTVKLFDNVARIIPRGVMLDGMSRKGNELKLTGQSVSNDLIATFMKNLQRLRWVKNTILSEIKAPGTVRRPDAEISKNIEKIKFTVNIELREDGAAEDKEVKS